MAATQVEKHQNGSGGGSTAVSGQTNAGSGPTSSGAPGSNSTSESALGGESESSAGGTTGSTDSNLYSVEGPSAPSSAVDGHGYGFPYGREVHNTAEGGIHAFGPRQPFGGPGPKQLPAHQLHQPHQQRFVGGPSISQPSGTTPTLNQLLQSNNPLPHRYSNSYAHPDQHYGQPWQSQKPLQQGYSPGPPASAAVGSPASSAPYRAQPTVSFFRIFSFSCADS